MKKYASADHPHLLRVINSDRKGGVDGFYARRVKRTFDMTVVLMALPFVLPLILLLAMLVALEGGKPFYTQARVGRYGKPFRMFKLRTMVPDAEAALKRHLESDPAAREEWEATQKLKKDPRVTFLGRFLRKSSLDELPQLLNVLIGDMSIVGPRPIMVSQQVLYPGADYVRLRPGLTGMWQVTDRNDSTFAKRASFDAEYAMKLNWRTDFRIIWQTVGVVLRCTGY